MQVAAYSQNSAQRFPISLQIMSLIGVATILASAPTAQNPALMLARAFGRMVERRHQLAEIHEEQTMADTMPALPQLMLTHHHDAAQLG